MLESETFVDSPFDNRIGTVSNRVTTWTLYDGSSPIMDFSGSGALEVRYLQGPAGILARESASGVIAWYLSDRLGTVSDVIDNLGNVIDHVDYTAFGAVIDETAPGAGDRFVSFARLLRDNVTGLNLAVERAENPAIGRWTQQDPLSFAAGDANLYRYVGNDDVGASDPSGLTPNQSDAQTWEQFVRYLMEFENAHGGPAGTFPELLEQLRALAQSYRGDPKYVYTRKHGWIDLNHFFNAALLPAHGGGGIIGDVLGAVSILGGIGVEFIQLLAYLCPDQFPDQGASAFTFEDLPSNQWGAFFGAGFLDPSRRRLSLADQVRLYFSTTMGGVLPPESVPGYLSLPTDELTHQKQWQNSAWGWIEAIIKALGEVGNTPGIN